MSKSVKTEKKAVPTFSRPWINEFPERELASRAATTRNVPDEDLKASVLTGCVVAYVDERKRTHVMEARAYGPTTGNRKLLIGYQIDGALVAGPMWKAVERCDRVFIIERNVEFPKRTIPPQLANQFTGIPALAPETGLDFSKHEADGY